MEEEHSNKWAKLALLISIVIIAYLLWTYVIGPMVQEWQKPAEVPVKPTSGEQQVVSPEVDDTEDFAEYTEGRPIPPPETDRSVEAFNRNEHVRGNPDATISLIEFTNMTNFYAGLLHPELKDLVERRSDVNWAFRHYPMQSVKLDYPLALAAECIYLQSGDHGAFWAFVDLAFSEPPVDLQAIYDLSTQVGANRDEIQFCVENGRMLEAIVDDKRGAVINGKFKTVPSFFFVHNETGETRFMQGVDTIDFIERVLDEML